MSVRFLLIRYIGEMPYFRAAIIKKILKPIIALPILKKNPTIILQLFILNTFEDFSVILHWNRASSVKTNKLFVG